MLPLDDDWWMGNYLVSCEMLLLMNTKLCHGRLYTLVWSVLPTPERTCGYSWECSAQCWHSDLYWNNQGDVMSLADSIMEQKPCRSAVAWCQIVVVVKHCCSCYDMVVWNVVAGETLLWTRGNWMIKGVWKHTKTFCSWNVFAGNRGGGEPGFLEGWVWIRELVAMHWCWQAIEFLE